MIKILIFLTKLKLWWVGSRRV